MLWIFFQRHQCIDRTVQVYLNIHYWRTWTSKENYNLYRKVLILNDTSNYLIIRETLPTTFCMTTEWTCMNFSLHTTKAANSLLHLSSFIEFRKPDEYCENIFKDSVLKIKGITDMSHLKFRCFYEEKLFQRNCGVAKALEEKKNYQHWILPFPFWSSAS